MSGGELALRVMISGTGKCYIILYFLCVKYKAASALFQTALDETLGFHLTATLQSIGLSLWPPHGLPDAQAHFDLFQPPLACALPPFPLALSGNKLVSYQHLEVLCICYTLHVWMGKSHRSQSLYVCIFRSSAANSSKETQISGKPEPICFAVSGTRIAVDLCERS